MSEPQRRVYGKLQEIAIMAIVQERAYQDLKYPKKSTPSTLNAYVALISGYTGKLRPVLAEDNKGTKANLDVVREIAALCLRAMEEHGVVIRENV